MWKKALWHRQDKVVRIHSSAIYNFYFSLNNAQGLPIAQ